MKHVDLFAFAENNKCEKGGDFAWTLTLPRRYKKIQQTTLNHNRDGTLYKSRSTRQLWFRLRTL